MREYRLAVATAAAALALTVIGGLVEAQGAALACPDWPLCNDRVLPDMTGAVLVEHGHRIVALAVAILTATLAALVVRSRADPGVRRLAMAAVTLVGLQAALGAITVVYALPVLARIPPRDRDVLLRRRRPPRRAPAAGRRGVAVRVGSARPMTAATAQARVPPSALQYAKDVLLLAKPRLSGLVVLTSAGGLALAPGRIGALRGTVAIVGTAAVVGAANALNCWLERDVDARMHRTRDRPLPAGRVEPFVALALGIAIPIFALPLLALAANPLTALLAFVALAIYVAVYTPMKQRSTLALFVGAVPGAIPPLMGWTAVTGRLDAGGLALFALLFAWQLPHFLAISIYLAEDYARGGLKVFALVHGEAATRRWIAAATVVLVGASLALLPLGIAGRAYGAVAAAAGVALLAYALSGLGRTGGRWARNLFLATLLYLTVLFVALLALAG